MGTERDSKEKGSEAAGTLFVVGTPIGNLEDITLRALRVLKESDLIAAEDTRRTRKLLSHYDIHTPMQSYHEHNKRARIPQLVSRLSAGARIALVSDAGMPGISDPGHDLIVSALRENIRVTVVPGPTSLISALVLSGMPTEVFTFRGFPPRKTGERRRFLEKALAAESSSIMFESPHRILEVLETIAELAPDRKVAVARELTKKFEQVLRGTAEEIAGRFKEQRPRGECIIIIEGAQTGPAQAPAAPSSAPELVERLIRDEGLTKKEAMRKAAKRLGLSRREIYRLLLEEKSSAADSRDPG